MKNNEWYDLGEKIRDTVQSAIDSQDFNQLNKTINNAVNSALDGVRTGIQSPNRTRQHPERRHEHSRDTRTVVRSNAASYNVVSRRPSGYDIGIYARRPSGCVAGPVLTSVGFSFMGLFAVLTISFLLAGIFSFGQAAAGFLVTTAIMAVLALGCFGAGMRGVGILQRLKRFRRYVQLIGERGYCEISELVSKTGKSKAFVLKDLKMMIQNGMFLDGHIDDQQTCLIVTKDAYGQYQKAQEELRRKREEDMAIASKKSESKASEECRKILEEGNAYIRHIHECNEAIPGEEISGKLTRLEEIMKRIFNQVERSPEIAPELHKFMNYYLPTTGKLIDAYQELDNQPIAGENIASTKREIEDTLDTINSAFEKLLDRFFQDTAWDISSDISVMKTMLAQEGLTGTDFIMKKDNAPVSADNE